ncbi:S9 family peptidase [Methanospirillum hungatei]|uniref:alpha/beta hydrolase family protein n=1 Tax=Methanospirillum hungatei TaxID=2203 RepID=UPI0026F10EEF|nr:alpha/beta hydrolase [Methanospirillum hungatei]MCA1915999.1 alpha/beta hydrolase [Methanospirillum hungatei]
MQRPSASFTGGYAGVLMNNIDLLLALILAISLLSTGCMDAGNEDTVNASWNLSPDGSIGFSVPECAVKERILEEERNLTSTDLIFKGFAGDVHAILISPKNPAAFLIWAPGANNPAAGYAEYMHYYPEHGIGVLIMDVRGNGGATPGYPMNIEKDAGLFMQGAWPEFYLIAVDMIAGREYLQKMYPDIPIYAVGDSNGGRYAALAAASDPDFAGYIGISTSGFHHMGEEYTSPVREFLLSIDPDVQVARIVPRPVVLFHAPDDPVIPFTEGETLAASAGKEAMFIPFNGTHGVNREVDDRIITLVLPS